MPEIFTIKSWNGANFVQADISNSESYPILEDTTKSPFLENISFTQELRNELKGMNISDYILYRFDLFNDGIQDQIHLSRYGTNGVIMKIDYKGDGFIDEEYIDFGIGENAEPIINLEKTENFLGFLKTGEWDSIVHNSGDPGVDQINLFSVDKYVGPSFRNITNVEKISLWNIWADNSFNLAYSQTLSNDPNNIIRWLRYIEPFTEIEGSYYEQNRNDRDIGTVPLALAEYSDTNYDNKFDQITTTTEDDDGKRIRIVTQDINYDGQIKIGDSSPDLSANWVISK